MDNNFSSQGEQSSPNGNSIWLLQANPNEYDIDSALRVLSEIDWIVPPYAREIHVGHKLYLWRAGENSALIASATVSGAPAERSPKDADLMFYKRSADAGVTRRVSLRIDKVFDQPITKDEFLSDPILRESWIIRQPNSTNYQLTPIEKQAIESILMRHEQLRRDAKKAAKAAALAPAPPPEPLGYVETNYTASSANYVEPSLEEIVHRVRETGIKLEERLIKRYHLALHSRGFVILAGLSGTGKTWLSKAYADAVGAIHELVCVAPNWTKNEDLLGCTSPFKNREYVDTTFSAFLRQASNAYDNAISVGLNPRPFHVVLDEMNLARVEYYFAIFLSKMEERSRTGSARIRLGYEEILLPPNLFFIGTVNMDETTHGFSDKVYDRAQVLELEATEDLIAEHIAGRVYSELLLSIWRIFQSTAPFSYRVIDDIVGYVDHAQSLSHSWEEAFDEQVKQKILPKVKGNDHLMEESLHKLLALCDPGLPLTKSKIQAMLSAKDKIGQFSYFI